jgi:predicted RNase H-like HicB family nuclease
MTHYIGIVDGSGDVWGVRIPDCPGAYGAGATAEAAIASAVAGLSLWAGSANGPLPSPRSLADVLADDPLEAGEVIALIPLLLDAGRTVRANLTFDAGLLAAIDAEADRRGLTRSAFLASAAREKIAAHR